MKIERNTSGRDVSGCCCHVNEVIVRVIRAWIRLGESKVGSG